VAALFHTEQTSPPVIKGGPQHGNCTTEATDDPRSRVMAYIALTCLSAPVVARLLGRKPRRVGLRLTPGRLGMAGLTPGRQSVVPSRIPWELTRPLQLSALSVFMFFTFPRGKLGGVALGRYSNKRPVALVLSGVFGYPASKVARQCTPRRNTCPSGDDL